MMDHFPDNTVLCNFAAVDQLDLLKTVLDGRGRWTEAVAYEAGRSAVHLPPLATVPLGGWLGEPIEIEEDVAAQEVEGLRRAVFGGLKSEPLRHLGEAQTLWVIRNKYDSSAATWVSDDRESLDFAKGESIPTKRTVNLVAEAVQLGQVSAASGYAMLDQMVQSGRMGVALPSSAQDLLFL